MASNKILALAIALFLLVITAECKVSSKSKDRTTKGLRGGERVVGFIAKLGDSKNSRMFDALGKMSAFLGAAGGVITFALAFVPKSESAELRYMKLKFAEVNMKLDQITLELDNIKSLITYENQRSVYLQAASRILLGHRQLLAFLDELEKTPCDNEDTCKRVRSRIASRYVSDFDVKADLFEIVHGAMKATSAFGDPLLDVIKTTFKCDVGKIDHLANSILKLSFKGQQVILAHEKLSGSEYSITQSMNNWLSSIYDLREHAYKTKKQCLDKIYDYMIADLNEKKYQVDYSSNDQANEAMKTFMDSKYKWLGWVVHSYGAYGGSKHVITNVFGRFWNMPSDRNERRRNLIVSFTDKGGTYANQKFQVLKALDTIVANTNFHSVEDDAGKQLGKVREELQKEGVWKFVTSVNILREYDDLFIEADDDLTFISEEYEFTSRYKPKKRKKKERVSTDTVRLVIVLKSQEQANGVRCVKPCEHHGVCYTMPYASTNYCHCKANYQGDKCEEHAQTQLATTMDAMLETTFKLPMISDISYDISDLREFVGISFGEVQSAISELDATFRKAFNDLSYKISTNFQWTNLITHYSDAIRKIEFYTYRFQELPGRYPTAQQIEGKKLATAILAPGGIEKWLYEVNYLFNGRSGTPLVNHQPLMLAFMNRYKSSACTASYKTAVDNTWRQLVLLQQMGFMIWAQALEFMGRPTQHTAQLYATRTAIQVSTYNRETCEYIIPDSANVQCSGGRYLHRSLAIVNQCKANYYVSGYKETTCIRKMSACQPCNCNAVGSHNLQCSDHSGQCSCKPGFYGKQCQNRDCVWAPWLQYSHCSKGCDYGGTKTRTRPHQVTKQGQGKACSGPNTETISCFQGCCSGQFHCSNTQKCIRGDWRCNYIKDCDDNQDEDGCNERCFTKYTGWNSLGNANLVYLDRHALDCGGNDHVMKMFHLETSGDNIRYKFICCILTHHMCRNHLRHNPFTTDGDGSTHYLDRQPVSCGDNGYISSLHLSRSGDLDYVRYNFHCCSVFSNIYNNRASCYTASTGYTDDGDGDNYFLDRQTVECKHRYFLTYFHLQRSGDHAHWRYNYRCCQTRVR